MWGGGNSISSVSFPVSDSVTLGARGATGIKDSLGNAGTYDSTARTLTMPALTPAGIAAAGGVTNIILSTPISTLTTGAVVTVTPSQSRRIYQVEASVPITLTNDLSQLGANCTTNYEWETWINYTVTNALSTVWDSRIQWAQQTPDLTVTGLYKFAFSTACGTNIQARQVYPTVYTYAPLPFASAYGAIGGVSLLYAKANLSTTTATNALGIGAPSSSARIVRTSAYGGITTNRVAISMGRGAFYEVPTTALYPFKFYAESAGTTVLKLFYQPPTTSLINADYMLFFYEYSTSNVNIPYMESRQANELEVKAYNAGWRP
jgi:hypothetical protein